MTINEEQLIQNVIDDLGRLDKDKPWKSVSTLAKKFKIQESYMRQLLLEYTERTDAANLKIRYSHYPSKRNLDMIWAHIKNIQRLEELYDYTRVDEADRRFPDDLRDYPCLFLSHSHRNQDRALYMRDFLLSHGINVWMSELDIVTGADIFVAINNGMENCVGIIADVTETSVQSVWVQKEFIVSLDQRNEVYIVIDGNNGRLIEALNSNSPESVLPSLQVTTVFPEYLTCLKQHAERTEFVFAFPYVEDKLFGIKLKPLRDLKDLLLNSKVSD